MTRFLKKGEILQQVGDHVSDIYVVKSGLLRSYSLDHQGKEHIYMFASEDWIIADHQLDGEPAMLFIDALEDSEIELVPKSSVTPADMDAKKIMRRLSVLQERIIMLMSSTAIERYEHFIKTYPDIVQRVPQKMIASYLGITPEALSRAKKERLNLTKSIS